MIDIQCKDAWVTLQLALLTFKVDLVGASSKGLQPIYIFAFIPIQYEIPGPWS